MQRITYLPEAIKARIVLICTYENTPLLVFDLMHVADTHDMC
jgi:hypothetical protein